MPLRLKIRSILLYASAFTLLSGCITVYNAATEKKETLLIDTQGEIQLGRDMDKDIQKKLKILDDPRMQTRLETIGARIAGASDRQDLSYNFRVVNDKELNAFAVPGGFIYVNSGLIDIADDNELACVLAHEVGHIAARHSVKKLQAVMGYRLLIGIVTGLTGNQTVSKATDIVFSVVNLGYSRQDEYLADKLAVKYAKKAGFNPKGIITFFEKLKQENQKAGPNSGLVFLSSHPPIDERIKKARDEIALNH